MTSKNYIDLHDLKTAKSTLQDVTSKLDSEILGSIKLGAVFFPKSSIMVEKVRDIITDNGISIGINIKRNPTINIDPDTFTPYTSFENSEVTAVLEDTDLAFSISPETFDEFENIMAKIVEEMIDGFDACVNQLRENVNKELDNI